VRTSGGKLVTFEEKPQRPQTASTTRPSTTVTTVQSKPKSNQNRGTMNFASDDEKTYTNTGDSDDDQYTERTKPGAITEVQPQPRKTPTVINTLVSGSMRPSIVNNNPKTAATIVRPSTSIKKYESDR